MFGSPMPECVTPNEVVEPFRSISPDVASLEIPFQASSRPLTLKAKALKALKALQELESEQALEIFHELAQQEELEDMQSQDVPDSTFEPSMKQEKWKKYPVPQRITTAQMLGNGIGENPGYSSLDIFIAPDYPPFKVMPFIEVGGAYFTDKTYGATFGIGGRYLSDTLLPLIGFNAFYDYRQGEYGSFHQLGLGVELTSPLWGFNFNGYIPMGSSKQGLTCVYDDYIGDYKAVNRQLETCSPGFNTSVSLLAIQQGPFYLYTFGGPYFFAKQGISPAVFGGFLTLQPQYKDYISVSLTVSHDPVFGTLFQGGISLSLPLYRRKNTKGPGNLRNEQIYQPVNRMPTISLQRHCCWKSNF